MIWWASSSTTTDARRPGRHVGRTVAGDMERRTDGGRCLAHLRHHMFDGCWQPTAP